MAGKTTTKKTTAKSFVEENPETDGAGMDDQSAEDQIEDTSTEDQPEEKVKAKSKPKDINQGLSVVPPGQRTEIPFNQFQNEVMDLLKKEKRIAIKAPELPGSNKNKPKTLDIGVNGVIFRIQRGEEVSVPASIYEAYMHSQH
jgi:hypothetical protein